MFSSTHTAYKSKLLAIYLCWWKLVASACLEALPQKVQKSSITDPERSQCGWRGGNDGQIWTNVLSQSVLCDTLCQLAQSCAARTTRDSLQELICMPTGQLMDHSQAVAAPNPNTKQLRTFHPDSQQDRSRLNRVLRDGPNPLAAESIPNDLGSWDSLAQRSHVFSTSAPLPPGWPCRAAAIVTEFCPILWWWWICCGPFPANLEHWWPATSEWQLLLPPVTNREGSRFQPVRSAWPSERCCSPRLLGKFDLLWYLPLKHLTGHCRNWDWHQVGPFPIQQIGWVPFAIGDHGRRNS